jgi:type IV pilus assembly protein PilN
VEPLNLASRPFRNERLPAALFGLVALAVVALTVWQALEVRRLLASESPNFRQRLLVAKQDLIDLRAEASYRSQRRVGRARIEEWKMVRDVVDQRSFSWTELLSRLERVLPAGVRLVSINPGFEEGRAVLELDAVARSIEEGFEFASALQRAEGFENVRPHGFSPGDEGDRFSYGMQYRSGVATESAEADR